VFNIKGNNYRTVVLIVFFAGTAAIRFIGTHKKYDKIKDIKTI
jgi:mRNA interferase HigB